MARIIFISEYLRGGKQAAQLANRTRYFATRPGVEKIPDGKQDELATDKQREYVHRLVRSYPQSAELLEYEDYMTKPSRGNAQEFIDQVHELYVDVLEERENFVDYVANRPGVQTYGDHGLWDKNGKVPVLSRAVEEVANHPGVVWTPVVSIRREDAERLGYTDAENWRALVNATLGDIAHGYKIPLEHLRWYAAFHEKKKHVHIHMIIFSSDPKEGYLTSRGIRNIKAAFARQIFRQDMIAVYEQQTLYRNQLQREAQEQMSELIRQMENGTLINERLIELMAELTRRLQNTKGKKVYGYLPPTTKRIVDAIVDELAGDERIAAAYKLWYEMREETFRIYNEKLPERLPLSQQKEFKPVRNLVIREALRLGEEAIPFVKRNELYAGDIDEEKLLEAVAQNPHQTNGISYAALGSALIRMLHHMSRIFQENMARSNTYTGLQIDRKRRRKLQQKRTALGHKPDDHEDPAMQQWM